eukprot:CAMPEP_0171279770 /NCGR_PEP_ID=MMETSP0790-20130122/65557_1 /TAXON_ID=2925 /ORGANISM="Alexandrium catenella, Strain OF101" /LENGTH=205 /DNA_ID=CAMNT_0011748971 /DNA_START=30 /DNA_END=645 /DNA_ORIENTATION=-
MWALQLWTAGPHWPKTACGAVAGAVDLEGRALPLPTGAGQAVPAESPQLLLALWVSAEQAPSLAIQAAHPLHRLHKQGRAGRLVVLPHPLARGLLDALRVVGQHVEVVEERGAALPAGVGPPRLLLLLFSASASPSSQPSRAEVCSSAGASWTALPSSASGSALCPAAQASAATPPASGTPSPGSKSAFSADFAAGSSSAAASPS